MDKSDKYHTHTCTHSLFQYYMVKCYKLNQDLIPRPGVRAKMAATNGPLVEDRLCQPLIDGEHIA